MPEPIYINTTLHINVLRGVYTTQNYDPQRQGGGCLPSSHTTRKGNGAPEPIYNTTNECTKAYIYNTKRPIKVLAKVYIYKLYNTKLPMKVPRHIYNTKLLPIKVLRHTKLL